MSSGINRPKVILTPKKNDWLFSDEELDMADEFLEEEVKIDSSHDIPYAAGYSEDGLTIYIDKEVPEELMVATDGLSTAQVSIPLHKTFAFHEMVEKSLEDEPYNMPYQLAHQIALRSERALVESYGASWNDYNRKSLAIVAKIYKRKSYDNVPKDLDLEPYECEEDDACLARMGIDDKELD